MELRLAVPYTTVCRALDERGLFPCFYYPPGDDRPELIYFRRTSFNRETISDDAWEELYRNWELQVNPGPDDQPFFANWLRLSFYLPARGEIGSLLVDETEHGPTLISLQASSTLPIELLPYLDRIGEVVLRLIDALRGGPLTDAPSTEPAPQQAALAREVRADAKWRLHQLRQHRAEIYRRTRQIPKWSDACAAIGIDASTVRKHDPELAERWGDPSYGDLTRTLPE